MVSAVSRERSLTDTDPNLALIHGLRSADLGGVIALPAQSERDGELLAQRGLMTLTPFDDAADPAVRRLIERVERKEAG